MFGHAIEARLNAEDPVRGFLPSTGPIVRFDVAKGDGLRVDAGVEAGSVISPFYDSMIAKLIAYGADRSEAIARLARGLEDTLVAGPRTNASFLHALVTLPAFRDARMDTGLIGRELAALAPRGFDARAVSAGVARMLLGNGQATQTIASPWGAQDGFQMGGPRRQKRTALVDGKPMQVEVQWSTNGPAVTLLGDHPPPPGAPRSLHVVADGRPIYVLCDMRQTVLDWPTFDAGAADETGDDSAVRAPIIGRVAKIFVGPGDKVAKGDRIAVVEAMKMEHVLHAPRAGRIDKLPVREGDQVTLGALIAALAEG
jgi:3-methylcrotonyl-CoA carboxylase alpha subunit